jgi:hypothetical protein
VTHAQDGKATKEGVIAAVRGWCDGLLKISQANRDNKDPKAVATEILTTAYDYDNGQVLFKPTLAFGDQTFRLTKEGALAYFVGGNPEYPNDSGFALKDWVKADFTTAGVITRGDIGLYMGNVMLTDSKGNVTTVDKTFGFDFSDPKNPKIILHKSALPFNPGTKDLEKSKE